MIGSTQSLTFALAILATGCLPTAKNVLGEADTGGSDEQTPSDGSEQPGSDGMADAPGTDGPDGNGDTDGGPPVGVNGVVRCADLPPDGPVVAGGELSATGFPEFRCDPRLEGEVQPGQYNCCSVDPASASGLPAYEQKDIPGTPPYFAEASNGLGSWGMCVRTDEIPAGSGLVGQGAVNCPIPCNPTWAEQDIDTVCGTSRVCCQTHEIQPADCIQDDGGVWRPVSGMDIPDATNWSPSAHATHQDANGVACTILAEGDQQSDVFLECIARLTVADQRGVCMALGVGQVCPAAAPSYTDACEQLNAG